MIDFNDLFAMAHSQGEIAATDCTPAVMHVMEHANPFDSASPIVSHYAVSAGVCGFAGVVIKPGTSRFARYMKAHHGAYKHYYGGVYFPVNGYGQSMERKEAYGRAFAEVLRAYGVNARAESRMD